MSAVYLVTPCNLVENTAFYIHAGSITEARRRAIEKVLGMKPDTWEVYEAVDSFIIPDDDKPN